MWLRLLIAAQILAVTVLAGITVARYPLWTLVDEGAHFDYVQSIADDGRLPVVTDLVSPQVEAIAEHVYPAPPRKDPAKIGLGGRSYEAQQPPLYYLLAVPAFAAGGSDYKTKARVIRAFDVLFLLGAIAVFLALCRDVLGRGDEALAGTALAPDRVPVAGDRRAGGHDLQRGVGAVHRRGHRLRAVAGGGRATGGLARGRGRAGRARAADPADPGLSGAGGGRGGGHRRPARAQALPAVVAGGRGRAARWRCSCPGRCSTSTTTTR